MGCINRDKNSVLNMKKITLEFLEKGSRPEKYRRENKLEPKIKNKKPQPRRKSKKEIVSVSSVG